MKELESKDGSTFAVKYANKIDYVSPVWFDLVSNTGSNKNVEIKIDGYHNVDEDWMAKLKEANPKIKIFPRVYLSGEQLETLRMIVRQDQVQYIGNLIIAIAKKYKDQIDGILFDSPLINYLKYVSFDFFYFTRLVSEGLGELDKDLILSFMPQQGRVEIVPSSMEKFIRIAHKVLITTYDYQSSVMGDFPISPQKWVKENLDIFFNEVEISHIILKQKLMVGIPFYGYKSDYASTKGHEAIVNEKYIDFLNEYKPKITWNSFHEECFIHLQKPRAIDLQYPCLKFLKKRLELAEEYGIGVFVWEGGQGLEYFYNLF